MGRQWIWGQVSVLTGTRERRYVPNKLRAGAVALDHGTWRKRLTGGFLITDGAPSFKQQASSLTSFKLRDIMGDRKYENK